MKEMTLPFTYEQVCGIAELPHTFNWLAILKDLKNGAQISIRTHTTLSKMAGMWPTCACGQLCNNLERSWDGSPFDPMLRNLGLRFYHEVDDAKWAKAYSTFQAIEERVMQLLQDECQTTSGSI